MYVCVYIYICIYMYIYICIYMCIYTYRYIQKKKQNFYYLELCVLRTWIGNYEVGDPKMWLDREVG